MADLGRRSFLGWLTAGIGMYAVEAAAAPERILDIGATPPIIRDRIDKHFVIRNDSDVPYCIAYRRQLEVVREEGRLLLAYDSRRSVPTTFLAPGEEMWIDITEMIHR